MRYLAHSASGGQEEESYQEHTCGTCACIKENLNGLRKYVDDRRFSLYEAIGENSAEWHDLGKLAWKNQVVLTQTARQNKEKKKPLPIDHRDAGIAWLLKSGKERPEAVLIYAHHYPGLPNLIEERSKEGAYRFKNAVEDTEGHLKEYLNIHRQLLGTQDREMAEGDAGNTRLKSMEYRILLSCLVDADYSDSSGDKRICPAPRWKERLDKLDAYVKDLHKENPGTRSDLRTEMYETCRAASTEAKMTYCDAAVGTGKTYATMAHMLQMALTHGLRHVFVILPYTSIIVQTVEALRRALVLEGEIPEEVVTELHHQADFETEEYRRLASTWRAPIIVTTAVEFFETIASNMPAKLRKLHQLVGSGIIIDESHAVLPIKLMPLAWEWLSELTSDWGCHVCFSSGTTIRFWEIKPFKDVTSISVQPILTDDVSTRLNVAERQRVQLNAWTGTIPHFHGMRELADYMSDYRGSRILILNTIQSAASMAYFMRERGEDVLHLSNALSPGDKRMVIKEVIRRLDPKMLYKEEWTLVATAGAECGMEFSFHYGFSEVSSLAGYQRLAGCIARNGDFKDSVLAAFTITEDKFLSNPSFVTSSGIFKKMVESEELKKLTVTEAVTKAFDIECKQLGGLSEELQAAEIAWEFEKVAEEFQVIEDHSSSTRKQPDRSSRSDMLTKKENGMVTVVVDHALASRIRSGHRVSKHELQLGSVSMRKSYARRLGLDVDRAEGWGIYFLKEGQQYDSFLGYMKTLI